MSIALRLKLIMQLGHLELAQGVHEEVGGCTQHHILLPQGLDLVCADVLDTAGIPMGTEECVCLGLTTFGFNMSQICTISYQPIVSYSKEKTSTIGGPTPQIPQHPGSSRHMLCQLSQVCLSATPSPHPGHCALCPDHWICVLCQLLSPPATDPDTDKGQQVFA